ncbi:MAG: hydrolase [Flavobacteriaceae bacterium]|nr:hydrolase [Flavobacteriaceae bacterium]|tara:strand:- start:110598 stop:111245 length:648 start_codon:yes stop_codon:yes gene_type:complete
MSKLKAVIFDLDGTVANTIPLIIKSVQHALEPLIDKTISDEEVVNTFGPSEVGTVIALAPNSIELGFQRYLEFYQKFHHMCPTPFNGIVELLDFLRSNNIRIAMVTGKSKESAIIDLELFGITHYFEMIETGIPTRPSKPDALQRICDAMPDISSQEMIYVGDAPTDVGASHQVSIPIVGAGWAKTTDLRALEMAKPDYLFRTIPDFLKWLKGSI